MSGHNECIDRALNTWCELQEAHRLMCNAEYFSALELYRRVLKKLRTYLNLPEWQRVCDCEERPSRNWLCVYLFEYYQIDYGWVGWRWLAEPVLQSGELEKLSLRAWSRFQSALGWAYIRHKPLGEIRRMQYEALRRLKGKNLPFEEGLHHLVLCHVEQLALREESAHYHAYSALERFKFDESPFYAMRLLFLHSNMYRIVDNFKKAQELIDRLTDYTTQKGVYRTALGPHIVQGWIDMDTGNFERAAQCFQEAIEFLGEQGLVYEQGRARYGLGCLYLFVCNDPDTAEPLIRAAIDVYYDGARYHDPAYVHYFGQNTQTAFVQATYQNVLVNLLVKREQIKAKREQIEAKRKQIEKAFEYELEALALFKGVDDRGNRYDIYLTLSQLSYQLKKYHLSIFYWLNAVLRHPVTFLKHNYPKTMLRFRRIEQRLMSLFVRRRF